MQHPGTLSVRYAYGLYRRVRIGQTRAASFWRRPSNMRGPTGAKGETVSVVTGKRYRCPKCGAEFIATKGGDGVLRCDTDTDIEQV